MNRDYTVRATEGEQHELVKCALRAILAVSNLLGACTLAAAQQAGAGNRGGTHMQALVCGVQTKST